MIGTIGKTQGVSSDSAPIESASQMNAPQESAPAPNETGGRLARRSPGEGGRSAANGVGAAATSEVRPPSMNLTGTTSVTVRGGRHNRLVHA